MKRGLAALVPTLLFLGPSCATGAGAGAADPISEQLAIDWVVLQRRKAEVSGYAFDPRVFETPGQGAVQVREWHLEGGPGWEFVRAKFTYQNTTEEWVDEARITLVIENGDGSRSAAGSVRLTHPLGRKLHPGMLFNDEVRVETFGLHNDASGWRWRIAIEGVRHPDWGVAMAGDR